MREKFNGTIFDKFLNELTNYIENDVGEKNIYISNNDFLLWLHSLSPDTVNRYFSGGMAVLRKKFINLPNNKRYINFRKDLKIFADKNQNLVSEDFYKWLENKGSDKIGSMYNQGDKVTKILDMYKKIIKYKILNT